MNMNDPNNELEESATPKGEKPAERAAAAADKGAPANLSEAYQQVLAEKQELFDRLLRKQAELENMRKRLEREKEDFLQHAAADLIRALLPTLDSLERALRTKGEDVPRKFYDGIDLIHRGLLEVLDRAGVRVIPTQGKRFDPHVHQAVETVESERHGDQEIVEELQKGYALRHRLLRPAIVKVAVRKGGHGSHGSAEKAPAE
jgi:molecular chaperone GrpE